MANMIRLYVDADLAARQQVVLTRAQAHYLFVVMRQKVGGPVALFNGRDGTWRAEIVEVGKRAGLLVCQAQTAPVTPPPDLWLLFAPIKKARTDFIVEKATELGAARIMPVLTEFTNSERVRQDRLQAHAIEAAEQCGANVVPQVAQARTLSAVLAEWPATRRLMFCDEALAGQGQPKPPEAAEWAILIGPEGGFSTQERALIRGLAQTVPISLGPRVLRADTAAVAALTLWQVRYGEWWG